MFERRPIFTALLGLTLVVTIWHMSFQEAGSNNSSSNNGGNSLDSFAYLTASTPHHFAPPPAPLPSSYSNNNGDDEDDAGGGGGGGGYITRSSWSTPNWNSSSILLVNPLEMLPKDDYTSLIDLRDFKFTINFRNCSDSARRKREESARSDSLKSDERRSPLVLVLVHSAPTNWYKRNTIRDTWGQHDPRAKLVFLLGAVDSDILQRRIEQENRMYDDIVQGSFKDAYRNMTYKHVMALKWFTYHCPEAKYILKADDDVFVNTPTLYDALESTSSQQHRRKLLFCQQISEAPVKRTHRSKWFVSINEYRNKYYPRYCPGYSIIYTPDVALALYREAQKQPYFWIDDVHMTGTIAQRVNVSITPTGNMLLNRAQKDALLQGKLNATEQPFFFTTPDLREGEIRKLWKAVSQASPSSRSSRSSRSTGSS